MPLFNQNTFNPLYPESNDKKGEVQILRIVDPFPVDETYTQEMRLDQLPIFCNSTNAILKTFPVGRQTMYRTVMTTDHMLPWSLGETTFLNIDGGASNDSNPRFLSFISDNVTGYQNFINSVITAELGGGSIQITKVHVIGSNIQMMTRTNSEHTFLHTYDVIFYGQETPNPNPPAPPTPPLPPQPPCEQLAGDYTMSKQFPQGTTFTNFAFSTDDGGKRAVWTLLAKGGGSGTQTQTVVGNMLGIPAYLQVIGFTYTFKVETPALVAGSTINVVVKVQDVQVFNFQVSDVAKILYFPVQVLSGSWKYRVEFARQLPTSGLPDTPDVPIKISLSTDTCATP
jgi:hypothetical protein